MSELAYRRRRRSILLLVCLWYQAAVVNSWSEKTRTIVAGGRRILLSAPVKGPVFLTKSSSTRSSVTSKFTPAMVRQFPGTGERIAAPKTAIVITVHGALDYLAMCLDSIAQHSTGVHLFIADDSANETESAQLSEMLKRMPIRSTHIVMDPKEARGYTLTINAGLRRAHDMGCSVMICLNSDAVVTPLWLDTLLATLQADAKIGMAGPIGNAASFQSVPALANTDGSWSSNPLMPGWTPNAMAHLAFLSANTPAIETPILNGFLMAIRREVFDAIGYMDEDLFPFGFGEENDFALRTGQAGFKRVVVPSVYIYHHKTKSYTVKERKDLVAKTNVNLEGKYKEVLKDAVTALKGNLMLSDMRERIKRNLGASLPAMNADLSVMFVLNIMPYKTGKQFMLHGGWISLVQEALGLARNGAHVRIAVQMWTVSFFAAAFPQANSLGIFWGFNSHNQDGVAEEVVASGMVFDFVVATHYSTVQTVLAVTGVYPNIVPGYYVQDIETRFSRDPAAVQASMDSYSKMRNGFVFVKTQWLKTRLIEIFNINAHLIPPTVDSELFHAEEDRPTGPNVPIHVCAMVRVETPRRNPLQTLQIMSQIADEYGPSKVRTTIFGSAVKSVMQFVKDQKQSLTMLQQLNMLGVLGRQDTAKLNRQCDVFLDFSSWQAFGRSGLEAMASGCVPILPITGGASEYAKDRINSFLIDTTKVHNALKVVEEIVKRRVDLNSMREAAIETAAKFSIEASSAATVKIFHSFKDEWQHKRRTRALARALAKRTTH